MLEMQLVTRAWTKKIRQYHMEEGFSRRWKELRINIRDLSLWLPWYLPIGELDSQPNSGRKGPLDLTLLIVNINEYG
jgi:hypothetical protein